MPSDEKTESVVVKQNPEEKVEESKKVEPTKLQSKTPEKQ